MTRLYLGLALSMVFAGPLMATDAGAPSAEVVEKIETVLADMECQMDPDDIEVTETGYELDDVFCEDGKQFDIVLDKDFNEVERRAE